MKGTPYERHHDQIQHLYFSGVAKETIATLLGVSYTALNAYLYRRGLHAEKKKHHVALVNQAAAEMKGKHG